MQRKRKFVFLIHFRLVLWNFLQYFIIFNSFFATWGFVRCIYLGDSASRQFPSARLNPSPAPFAHPVIFQVKKSINFAKIIEQMRPEGAFVQLFLQNLYFSSLEKLPHERCCRFWSACPTWWKPYNSMWFAFTNNGFTLDETTKFDQKWIILMKLLWKILKNE